MKQVIIKKGKVFVEEIPPPVVERGSILVKVSHSLISTGTELAGVTSAAKPLWQRALSEPENVRKVLRTARTQSLGKAMSKVKSSLGIGYSPGYSCSGIVIGIGEGVSDIKVGDSVACAGRTASHAEVVCVPRNLVVRVPPRLELKEAASVALGAIALQGVRRAAPALGETVVVIGLGLVGQLTAQLLKVAGCRVIGVDLAKSRVELAQKLGTDYGIVSHGTELTGEVSNYTSGLGADATIITAATKSELPLQQSMEITRKKGKVVIVGDVGLQLKRTPFYEKEIDLLISCSYGPGRYDESYERGGLDYPYAYVRWTENRNMQEYLKLLVEGRVNFKALISREYPVEDAALAYQALGEGKEDLIAALLSYPSKKGRAPGAKLQKKVTVSSKVVKKEGAIRVALIGAGSFAKSTHLPNLKRLGHLYRIYAVASATGTNAKETASRFGASYGTTDYSEVLSDKDVDMVLIATRHNLHARIAMEAAKAGKAVFLEKPMALNEAELDKLAATLQKTRVPFTVGFNRRFSPCAVRAKEVISARQNPIIVNYRVNAGYIPPDHWAHGEEGGGRIIGEACHMFDLFNYFTDSPFEGVTASAITPATSHIFPSDNFTATLKYGDGSISTLTYTSLGASEAGKEYIEIYADGKTLIIDDFKTLRLFGSKAKGISSGAIDKGHSQELIEFARCIKGQSGWPIPLEQLSSATMISFSVDDMLRH
jgi:predicted dehydrogenase/threonine dehydrogenase-like Zn-dependent dehydrogenase